jgi:nucleotidyltransferase substrate binding protein (TIGR01987 family)
MSTQHLDLTPFKSALESLEKALAQPKNEYLRDSVIQRFEYTYEFAWKTLKRYLEFDEGVENVDVLSRKDLFRLAAEKGLISDVNDWFEYHAARNESVHTYSEIIAEEIYEVAQKFVHSARKLLDELQRRSDD